MKAFVNIDDVDLISALRLTLSNQQRSVNDRQALIKSITEVIQKSETDIAIERGEL